MALIWAHQVHPGIAHDVDDVTLTDRQTGRQDEPFSLNMKALANNLNIRKTTRANNCLPLT